MSNINLYKTGKQLDIRFHPSTLKDPMVLAYSYSRTWCFWVWMNFLLRLFNLWPALMCVCHVLLRPTGNLLPIAWKRISSCSCFRLPIAWKSLPSGCLLHGNRCLPVAYCMETVAFQLDEYWDIDTKFISMLTWFSLYLLL